MQPIFHRKHSVALMFSCVPSNVFFNFFLAPLKSQNNNNKIFKPQVLFQFLCILVAFPKLDNIYLKTKTWHAVRNSVVIMRRLNKDQLGLLGHPLPDLSPAPTHWICRLQLYEPLWSIILSRYNCNLYNLTYQLKCLLFFSKEAYNFLFHWIFLCLIMSVPIFIEYLINAIYSSVFLLSFSKSIVFEHQKHKSVSDIFVYNTYNEIVFWQIFG